MELHSEEPQTSFTTGEAPPGRCDPGRSRVGPGSERSQHGLLLQVLLQVLLRVVLPWARAEGQVTSRRYMSCAHAPVGVHGAGRKGGLPRAACLAALSQEDGTLLAPVPASAVRRLQKPTKCGTRPDQARARGGVGGGAGVNCCDLCVVTSVL